MGRVRVHRLPAWLPMTGITLGHHVFLRNPNDVGTLQHELVHVAQQERLGWRFWVGYLFALPLGWNPWRARWEAAAYRTDVVAGRISAAGAARLLSGALYLWPCRYATALRLVEGAP